ncbi:hypothetical protein SAMN05216275_14326 [Streptosporangium canum]|uniref:Uncharacterized protein n=1 Tax=Streptosporangium canum TaxID=324952 RepID=A0A1I4DQC3_9ACTN|nr:hypothetical protein SAMN05216275_14326 [Streptosporangium canum]
MSPSKDAGRTPIYADTAEPIRIRTRMPRTTGQVTWLRTVVAEGHHGAAALTTELTRHTAAHR